MYLHTPSEHTVDGKHADAELQLLLRQIEVGVFVHVNSCMYVRVHLRLRSENYALARSHTKRAGGDETRAGCDSTWLLRRHQVHRRQRAGDNQT